MKKFILVALAALVLASPAAASNWPDARLDTAASSVAGHPVQVWCESSWADWIHLGDSVSRDFSYMLGFTFPTTTAVYINPDGCETLHALLGGWQIGSYHTSIALLTLAHESVHQRGISDEGVTDCTALPLVPGLAADHFGVPRTVTKTQVVSYTKTVVQRVNGKRVQVRVPAQKAVRVSVANPFLADLAATALKWHHAAPAEYQGTC